MPTASSSSGAANLEEDRELEEAIKLSLECEPSSSHVTKDSSILVDDDNDFTSSSSSDWEESNDFLATAKNYMVEYSGLTPAEITKIIGKQVKRKKRSPVPDSTTKCGRRSDDFLEIREITVRDTTTTSRITESKCSEIPDTVKKIGFLETKADAGNKQDNSEHPVSSTSDAALVEPSLSVQIPDVTASNDVEIMLDSDSDSSEKFVEVEDKESGLEILMKPTDNMDDDLFSDIFDDERSSVNKNLNAEDKSSTSVNLDRETREVLPLPSKRRDEVLAEKIETYSVIREMLKSAKDGQTVEGAKPDGKEEKVEISVEGLKAIQANLSQETKELRTEKAVKERMANNPTDQIYQEAQVKCYD